MRRALAAALCGALLAGAAGGEDLLIAGVTILDLEDGTRRPAHDVLVREGRIAAVGPTGTLAADPATRRIGAAGKFLVPSLWDMHVHSHRDGRWAYQHPLFLAHGVTGLRDAGSHLGSALAWRQRLADDPLGPDVVWGTPPLDGAPPALSFGLAAEDPEAARALVRELRRMGFDFLKLYDRLSPAAYAAAVAEARGLGFPVEGHVPLRLTPLDAVAAGQRLVDHLTLMLESCIPGALDWIASAENLDSMALLTDPRLAAALPRFDATACDAQLARHRAAGVWHVPTLVQMRGYLFGAEPGPALDARLEGVPAAHLAEWRAHDRDLEATAREAGRAVFRAQAALVGRMQRAGVRLLAGTDASSEPWVFAGASLHDELAELVAAGLAPAEALRAATVHPRLYLGLLRAGERAIAPGQAADLLLLAADPLLDVAASRRIDGVVRRGRWLDRTALDGLLAQARSAAARLPEATAR